MPTAISAERWGQMVSETLGHFEKNPNTTAKECSKQTGVPYHYVNKILRVAHEKRIIEQSGGDPFRPAEVAAALTSKRLPGRPTGTYGPYKPRGNGKSILDYALDQFDKEVGKRIRAYRG